MRPAAQVAEHGGHVHVEADAASKSIVEAARGTVQEGHLSCCQRV